MFGYPDEALSLVFDIYIITYRHLPVKVITAIKMASWAVHWNQPRSQGLSSLAPGGGKMRDPGNEVALEPRFNKLLHNGVNSITSDILCPGNSKIYLIGL